MPEFVKAASEPGRAPLDLSKKYCPAVAFITVLLVGYTANENWN